MDKDPEHAKLPSSESNAVKKANKSSIKRREAIKRIAGLALAPITGAAILGSCRYSDYSDYSDYYYDYYSRYSRSYYDYYSVYSAYWD